MLAASLVGLAPQAEAWSVDLSEGDFWTYGFQGTVSGVPVSGSVTYAFVGYDSLTVGSTEYEVQVLRVTGRFQGNVTSAGLTTSVAGVYDGYRYEVAGTLGVVKDETTSLENTSVGYDTLVIASSVERQESISYSPPIMSGFDPQTARVGDEWNESLEISVSSSYFDGTVHLDTNHSAAEVVGFTVLPGGLEQTDAGEFSVLRVMRTQGSTSETLSYADDAGRFVRSERYENGSSDPSYVAVLTDYSFEKRGEYSALVTLLAGALIASLTVLAIVVVLALARRRKESEPPEGDGEKDSEASRLESECEHDARTED